MSASIANRLGEVEEKLDFLMRAFQIKKQYRSIVAPDQLITETTSLYEAWKDIKAQQSMVIHPTEDTDDRSTDALA